MSANELYYYQSRQARQRKTITVQAVLLIIMVILVGSQAWQRHQDTKVIQALETLRTANDLQINNLAGRVAELEQEADAKAFEEAISTSRGSARTATVTAYTWTGDKTASGTWPKEGRTVAGPRNVPFGMVVWIDGVGERIVEDRTHSRYDGRYDVYMDNETDCIEWGIQQRVVR